MSRQPHNNDQGKVLFPALMSGGALYVLDWSGPITNGAHVNLISAAASITLFFSGTALVSSLFHHVGKWAEHKEAKIPTGVKGVGGFAKSLWEIRKDINLLWGGGTYFGTFAGGWWPLSKNRPVIAELESPCMVLGPNGSGKDTRFVQPNFFTDDRDSIYIALKGDECVTAKKPMEAAGRRVVALNIGGVFEDTIGPTDYYNPLHIIADNFNTPSGLQYVTDDCAVVSNVLSPEPTQKSGGGGENKVFRDGGRDLIENITQQVVLVHGYNATLGHVGEFLNDREALLREMKWVAGRLTDADGNVAPPMPIEDSPWVEFHDPEDVETYIRYYRGKANGLVDMLLSNENKIIDSFLVDARQALFVFNPTTRAHKILSKSTFRFSELKKGDQKTSVFIIPDATRLAAQDKVLGLIQWGAITEMRRHKNKKRKVNFYFNECTNYTVYDAGPALTIERSYGIVRFYIFQSVSAFRAKYGPETWGTLMSEAKAKLFLPGQRCAETLDLLEKMLSRESVVMKTRSGRKHSPDGIDGFNYSEDSKPVMSAEEIRRMEEALLFLGRNKPIKLIMHSISRITPWRRQIGGNPFYDGKPYLQRVRLRIWRDGGPLVRGVRSLWKFFRKPKATGETS